MNLAAFAGVLSFNFKKLSPKNWMNLPRLNPLDRILFFSMSMDVQYLKSAVFPKDYPPGDRPEIAIAGRSNAGKSSYINALTNSRIAKVSQTPGKTRLLSFFNIGEHYRFVDMPGYGFASRSGDEVVSWQKMIEDYLTFRENLVGLVLVIDINRDWQKDEAMLLDFMYTSGKPVIVVLTKADKLSKGEIQKRKKSLQETSGIQNIFPVSSPKNFGVEETEEFIFKNWVKPYRGTKK